MTLMTHSGGSPASIAAPPALRPRINENTMKGRECGQSSGGTAGYAFG